MTDDSLTFTDSDSLFRRLRQGSLMLTVNNRLAARVMQAFNQHMLASGLQAWETPQVLPLGAWLEKQLLWLSDRGDNHLQLLTPRQELQRWSEIIADDSSRALTLSSAGIAAQAAQAWALMQQWRIPVEELQPYDTAEVDCLLRWSDRFRQQCRDSEQLAPAMLLEVIVNALERRLLAVPPALVIAGFEDANPAQLQLFGSLQRAGCRLEQFRFAAIKRTTHRRVSASVTEEIETAANWVRNCLLAAAPGEALPRIGVVMPRLQEQRRQVERIFRHHLHNGLHKGLQGRQLFSLSLGRPLDDFPLVDDALNSLLLLNDSFSLDELSRVLRSRHLDLPTAACLQIDLALRRYGRQRWSPASLLAHLQQQGGMLSQQALTDWLKQLLAIRETYPGRQSSERWAEAFSRVWQLSGWPGAQSPNSDEYQQSTRLMRLLGEFRQLQRVTSPLSARQAIALLRQWCRDTLFQSQSMETPVLVCGLLEAADLQFDALWLNGMDDQAMPLQSAANALIPLAVQRRHDLPHSSAAREQAFSRHLLDKLLQQSAEVVVSHARSDADVQLRRSPMIDWDSLPDLSAPESTSSLTANTPAQLDQQPDPGCSEIPAGSRAPGGTGVLASQAACPFRASSEYRLFAHLPEQKTDGISPAARGEQVHQVMEKIWQQLGSLGGLQETPPETLEALLRRCIDEVLAPMPYRRPELYTPAFVTLESQRLYKLAANWLQIEQQRTTGFKIDQLEQRQELLIGGLLLTTRVDRIDRLDNGACIVIDYKTGNNASSRSWLEQRISEPQLPLYSLLTDPPPDGLALARITEKKSGFEGLAREASLLPGLKVAELVQDAATTDQWPAVLRHWQDVLETQAAAFREGLSQLDLDGCQYCAAAPLCRKQQNLSLSPREEPGETSRSEYPGEERA